MENNKAVIARTGAEHLMKTNLLDYGKYEN